MRSGSMPIGVWMSSCYTQCGPVVRECVNSVVRMPQGRHRHVSQGLLDLKRLYWNCRVFREGKRKGQSPYNLLGLNLPSSDWWQLLHMAPEELEQKLLSQ